MTRFASILGALMTLVAEENKIWEQINPSPSNWLLCFRVFEQRTKGGLGIVTALMAIQTVRSLRNSCLLAIRHRVADFAFQSQLSMALVAEFDRLFDGFGGHGLNGLLLVRRRTLEDRCEKQDG